MPNNTYLSLCVNIMCCGGYCKKSHIGVWLVNICVDMGSLLLFDCARGRGVLLLVKYLSYGGDLFMKR